MRKVVVTPSVILEGYRDSGDNFAVTGEDSSTGEMVTFAGDLSVLATFLVQCRVRDDMAAELEVEVDEADVLQIVPGESEPVSGEWDSPGTSPEDS